MLETDSRYDRLKSSAQRLSASITGTESSHAQPRRVVSAEEVVRNALLPFIGTRLVLLVVGLLAKSYIAPLINWQVLSRKQPVAAHFPGTIWEMWAHFDTFHYLSISMDGYGTGSGKLLANWAFYPLFPALMHPLGILFGGSRGAFVLAGFLIANTAALVAVAYIYLLVVHEFGGTIASRTILLLGFFPTAFYLSAVYSESVLLACCASCLYYGRQRRWWLAGLCGGLGTLARVQGIILLIPLVWELWQMLKERYALAASDEDRQGAPRSRLRHSRRIVVLASEDNSTWLSLWALALIPLSLLGFMLYAQFLTGDLFTTYHVQHDYWARQLVWPWQVLISEFQHPNYGDPMVWDFWVLNVGVTLSFLALTAAAFRVLPTYYALYMLGMVLLPLSSGLLNSIGRYSLVVFPAFVVLARWSGTDARPYVGTLLIGSFAALQALFMAFFVLSIPAIA